MIGIERLNIGGREINADETLTRGGSYTYEVIKSKAGPHDQKFHLFRLFYNRKGKTTVLREAGVFVLPNENGEQQLSQFGNGFLIVSGPTHPFLCALWSQGHVQNVDPHSPPKQGSPLWDLAPEAKIPCALPDKIVMNETITLRSDDGGLLTELLLSSAGVPKFDNLGFLPYGSNKRGNAIKGIITQGKPPYLCQAWLELRRKNAVLSIV